MAKGSAKKINANNARLVRLMSLLIGVSSVVFLATLLVTRSWSTKLVAGYFVSIVPSLFFLHLIFQMAGGRKTGAAHGKKEQSHEAGMDLDKPGLHQYMMDYIYISSFTHLLAAYTNRAWFLFISVLNYLSIHLYTLLDSYLWNDQANSNVCVEEINYNYTLLSFHSSEPSV